MAKVLWKNAVEIEIVDGVITSADAQVQGFLREFINSDDCASNIILENWMAEKIVEILPGAVVKELDPLYDGWDSEKGVVY